MSQFDCSPLLAWQLVDSAFPAGGFSHAAGLEAAWKQGLVPNTQALHDFLQANLTQNARLSLPIGLAAFDQPEDWPTLDRHMDALLSNHVARRASRQLGTALLTACARIFPEPDLQSLPKQARAKHLPTHLAPAFGVVAHHLQIGRATSAQMLLFMDLRAQVSAAVRLGLIGPLEAQTLQHRLRPAIEQAAQKHLHTPWQQAAACNPMLELAQMNQDRLYSRLFQS